MYLNHYTIEVLTVVHYLGKLYNSKTLLSRISSIQKYGIQVYLIIKNLNLKYKLKLQLIIQIYK